jgi:glycerophosphoryl diester phosphodiesterase
MANLLGYDVVDSVSTAINDAGYNDQTTQEVMIQSKDSAVLVKFKQEQTKYKLVYTLPQEIGSASATSLVAVKEFADAVVADALSKAFIMRQTDLVGQLQSVGLPTYVQVFNNEFVSTPCDFFFQIEQRK